MEHVPIDLEYVDVSRFWSHVDVRGPRECWPWLAYKLPKGYGYFSVTKPKRRNLRSHRVAWAITNGSDPGVMDVLHSCDNPPCCNPAHLSLGNNSENMAQAYERGRKVSNLRGESSPHSKLTANQVIDIRMDLSNGRKIPDIAGEYGVSRWTIGLIARGKTWRSVSTENLPNPLA